MKHQDFLKTLKELDPQDLLAALLESYNIEEGDIPVMMSDNFTDAMQDVLNYAKEKETA